MGQGAFDALQGRNLPNAMEIYRAITHALHGMRPKDFLLHAHRLLCNAVGARKLLAVLAALDAELDVVRQGQTGNLDELRQERAQTSTHQGGAT